jgi:hypothetical protein
LPPALDLGDDDDAAAAAMVPGSSIVALVAGSSLTCSFSLALADLGYDADAGLYLSLAHGFVDADSGEPQYHNAREQSAVALPLHSLSVSAAGPAPTAAGGNSKTDILLKAHGCIMVVVWLLLLPFGIFAGRFKASAGLGKPPPPPAPQKKKEEEEEGGAAAAASKPVEDQTPLWWRIHQPVQYVGVLLMGAAVVVAIVAVGPFTAAKFGVTHSGGAHGMIGVLSLSLTVLQPVGACFRNGCCEKDASKKERVHAGWHVVHAIGG